MTNYLQSRGQDFFLFSKARYVFFFNAATFSCINTGYIKMISSESYTTMKNLVEIFVVLRGGQSASKKFIYISIRVQKYKKNRGKSCEFDFLSNQSDTC